MEVDAAVIGGGVVGLACAAAFARADKSTVVLERHRTLGTETSSRHSEVIHAGLYYPRGSLKATMCVRGAELLYAWCAERSIPHARCGKIVVATSVEEEAALDALHVRATENGATVEKISGARVHELEPNVVATCGLSSPNTGILDSHAFIASLAAEIASRGGVVARGRTVASAERAGDRWVLQCDGVAGRERIEAAIVVNAAGLWADEVAAMMGATLCQRFVKGSYFRCRRPLVKRLVYPLPSREGLGVHATIDLAGSVRFGPDTEPAKSREDYDVDASRAPAFAEAIRKYIPSVRDDDLSPDMAGIRPKVELGDFVLLRDGPALHLAGIESPGLTASLAIAERVAMIMG